TGLGDRETVTPTRENALLKGVARGMLRRGSAARTTPGSVRRERLRALLLSNASTAPHLYRQLVSTLQFGSIAPTFAALRHRTFAAETVLMPRGALRAPLPALWWSGNVRNVGRSFLPKGPSRRSIARKFAPGTRRG